MSSLLSEPGMGYGIARPPAIAVLSQRIANLPCRIDDPSLLRVIVKQRVDSDPIDEGLAIGLDVPPFVRRTTDNCGGRPIPFPVHLKSRLRLRLVLATKRSNDRGAKGPYCL
jgi:hypothetical protein